MTFFKSKQWKLFTGVITAAVFFASVLLAGGILWAKSLWQGLEFEQILTNMMTPAEDFNLFTFSPAVKYYIAGVVLVFLLGFYKLSNRAMWGAAAVIIGVCGWQIKFFDYVYYQTTTGDLYEKHYVAPSVTAADFPAKKRNLLILYVESVEDYFTDKTLLGENLFYQTDALVKEAGAPQFKNYQSLYGTNYTKSALVAGHCGVVGRVVTGASNVRGYLRNIVCLSDILSENGYETWFGKTGHHGFAYTDVFYGLHNYRNIIDRGVIAEGVDEAVIEANESSFGGLSDKMFLSYVNNLFDKGAVKEPFLMTLFTVDTHYPDVVLPKHCAKKYGDLRDSILCSDDAVAGFLKAFRQSKYWENTTVAVVGDHPMFTFLNTTGGKKAAHKIYNAFLNLPEKMSYDPDKAFTALDLAPTFLESIGVKLKGRALGLGRSLFSNEKTLIEKEDVALALAVRQKSAMYDTFSAIRTPARFVPYKLGTVLDEKTVLDYADVKVEVLDKVFVEMLGLKLEKQPDRDLTLELELTAMISSKPRLTVLVGQNEAAVVKLSTDVGKKNIKVLLKKEFLTSADLHLSFKNNNYRSLVSESIAISRFTLY